MGRYAGVDWAAEKHDVLVADEAGEELLAATFAHEEKGLVPYDPSRTATPRARLCRCPFCRPPVSHASGDSRLSWSPARRRAHRRSR